MVESIYTWMQNIVFYLVIVTAVLEVLPGGNYQKYIRFFTGLVLMILLLTPVLSLAGVKETFTELYHGYEYEQYKREIKNRKSTLRIWICLSFCRKSIYMSRKIHLQQMERKPNSGKILLLMGNR